MRAMNPNEPYHFDFNKKGQIQFTEFKGDLWWYYVDYIRLDSAFRSGTHREVLSLKQKLPGDVVAQGEYVIRNHVEAIIADALEDLKLAFKRFDEEFETLELPVEHVYDGVVLRGRVIRMDTAQVGVCMDYPYTVGPDQIEELFSARHYERFVRKLLQEGEFNFTRMHIEGLFEGWYKEKKRLEDHGAIIDLAERLNKNS